MCIVLPACFLISHKREQYTRSVSTSASRITREIHGDLSYVSPQWSCRMRLQPYAVFAVNSPMLPHTYRMYKIINASKKDLNFPAQIRTVFPSFEILFPGSAYSHTGFKRGFLNSHITRNVCLSGLIADGIYRFPPSWNRSHTNALLLIPDKVYCCYFLQTVVTKM